MSALTVFLSPKLLGSLILEDALVAALGRENVANQYVSNVVNRLRAQGDDELADGLIAEIELYKQEVNREEQIERARREARARAWHDRRTYGQGDFGAIRNPVVPRN